MHVISSLQHDPFSAISSGSAEELLPVKLFRKNPQQKSNKEYCTSCWKKKPVISIKVNSKTLYFGTPKNEVQQNQTKMLHGQNWNKRSKFQHQKKALTSEKVGVLFVLFFFLMRMKKIQSKIAWEDTMPDRKRSPYHTHFPLHMNLYWMAIAPNTDPTSCFA